MPLVSSPTIRSFRSVSVPVKAIPIDETQKDTSFVPLICVLGVGGACFAGYWAYQTFWKEELKIDVEQAEESINEARVDEEKNEQDQMNQNDSKSNELVVRKESIHETLVPVPENSNSTVVFHQTTRGYYAPSVGPFALKLETFLRLCKIPYVIDNAPVNNVPFNTDVPWITLGGKQISEITECLRALKATFGVDLEKNASESRKSASRLVGVMLEDQIYWGCSLWRWVWDGGDSMPYILPMTKENLRLIPEMSVNMGRTAMHHGYAHYTKAEMIHLVQNNIVDLSSALGKHPFFLGAEPGETDCSAFSMLVQMQYNMPGSPFNIKPYKNLVKFVQRMKQKLWPDWDTLLEPIPTNFEKNLISLDSDTVIQQENDLGNVGVGDNENVGVGDNENVGELGLNA